VNTEIAKDVIVRTQYTETQTKKGRIERWQNIEGKFELITPEKIRNKNILLVDDVITTGATLEACGQELLQATPKLSVATLCFASR
jgi:predicted amidophosphoribosyltransferase